MSDSHPSEDPVWKARQGAADRRSGLDKTMLRIQKEGNPDLGGRLVGISESVKSEQSLRERVDRWANSATSPEDVIASTYDLNRYTFTVPTDRFAAGVTEKYAQLRKEDFEPIPGTHTDRFDDPAYKGMNTAWRHKTGYPIEVQFHTPESFQANRDSHPIYEAQQQRAGAGPRDGVDGADYRQAGRRLQAPYYEGVPIPDRQPLYDDQNIPIESRSEPLREASEAALQQVREDAQIVRDRIEQARQSPEQAPVRDAVLVGDEAGRSPPEKAGEPVDRKGPPDPRRALDDRVAEGMAARERQSTQDGRPRSGPAKDADRDIE